MAELISLPTILYHHLGTSSSKLAYRMHRTKSLASVMDFLVDYISRSTLLFSLALYHRLGCWFAYAEFQMSLFDLLFYFLLLGSTTYTTLVNYHPSLLKRMIMISETQVWAHIKTAVVLAMATVLATQIKHELRILKLVEESAACKELIDQNQVAFQAAMNSEKKRANAAEKKSAEKIARLTEELEASEEQREKDHVDFKEAMDREQERANALERQVVEKTTRFQSWVKLRLAVSNSRVNALVHDRNMLREETTRQVELLEHLLEVATEMQQRSHVFIETEIEKSLEEWID